jgi:hypothetical protein
MFGFEWRRVPVGHDTTGWGAREGRHTVLVVVHSATCGQHLLDVVRLVESDPRIRVVFATDSDTFARGVDRLLRDIEAVVVPWRQAATHHDFELVIATSLTTLRHVRAPSIVMPFGERIEAAALREAGYRGLRCSTGAHRVIHRCGAGPSSIVLSHEAEMTRLTRAFPETLPVTTVAGDPTYDRLTASLPLRGFYRRALGVGVRQKLVVVITGQQGPAQLDLLARLPAELPPEEYRVIALFPPDLTRPVEPGLADCMRRGLSVLPPEGDWRAALVAADWIIDDGAVGPYGAVTGVPVLLSGVNGEVASGSALAELVRVAPRLLPYRSLGEQLREATERHRPERHQAVLERITSEPGRFNRNMRSLMYRLLRLRQPLSIPTTDPVSPPFHLD